MVARRDCNLALETDVQADQSIQFDWMIKTFVLRNKGDLTAKESASRFNGRLIPCNSFVTLSPFSSEGDDAGHHCRYALCAGGHARLLFVLCNHFGTERRVRRASARPLIPPTRRLATQTCAADAIHPRRTHASF